MKYLSEWIQSSRDSAIKCIYGIHISCLYSPAHYDISVHEIFNQHFKIITSLNSSLNNHFLEFFWPEMWWPGNWPIGNNPAFVSLNWWLDHLRNWQWKITCSRMFLWAFIEKGFIITGYVTTVDAGKLVSSWLSLVVSHVAWRLIKMSSDGELTWWQCTLKSYYQRC